MKDNNIEKSDILDAIDRGRNDIIISKTGKEIKNQIDTVLLPDLKTSLYLKQEEADEKLKDCGKAPTTTPDKWWTSCLNIDCGYKIYLWSETYFSNSENKMVSSFSAEDAEEREGNIPKSQEEATSRREYNDIVRDICDKKVDIRVCEALKQVSDKKEYGLTPRQILILKF